MKEFMESSQKCKGAGRVVSCNPQRKECQEGRRGCYIQGLSKTTEKCSLKRSMDNVWVTLAKPALEGSFKIERY